MHHIRFPASDLDLDLESNRQTPGRDITPMEMKGGTTEDDAWMHRRTLSFGISAGRRFQEGMVRGKKEYLRCRIATDRPKLKTVVGSGAGICCSKTSCGYCHQAMVHFVHHAQPLIFTSLFQNSPALTGQLADKPTRGQSSRGLDNSRTGQLTEMFDLKFGV